MFWLRWARRGLGRAGPRRREPEQGCCSVGGASVPARREAQSGTCAWSNDAGQSTEAEPAPPPQQSALHKMGLARGTVPRRYRRTGRPQADLLLVDCALELVDLALQIGRLQLVLVQPRRRPIKLPQKPNQAESEGMRQRSRKAGWLRWGR